MKATLTILALMIASGLSAQTFSITGKAIGTDGSPLPGAHVELQHPWGEAVAATVTEDNGTFELKNVPRGGYKLKVSFLGYSPLVIELTLFDKPVDLGTLTLQPGAETLTEVQVKDRVPMGTVKGDTTEFNADAYKVMKDASAEDLVKKLPTVSIENGKVQAQGEDVKEVLVDGKRFFGNDPTAALRNLPAEVIQSIQVFDQESEQSRFSGVSDGNTSKTINIVTRRGMSNGQFGKVYAGYGTDQRYQSGGNLNFFNGDLRLSVIGMSNNVNILNFSSEDLLGVMGSGGRGWRGRSGNFGGAQGGRSFGGSDFLIQQSGGIATTNALGLNFSDQWGQKTEVTASYFFNRSSNNATSWTERQYIDTEGSGELYEENSNTLTTNANHRFYMRLEHSIDSSNSIIFQPNLSLQFNDGNSSTTGQTTLETSLLNSTLTDYNSDLQAVNFNSSLLWRHRFSKPGRTFSINGTTAYSPQKGDEDLYSLNSYFRQGSSSDTLNQRSTLDVNSWSVSSNISYTEPVGQNSQVEFSYNTSWKQEESDKYTYDFLESTGNYDLLNEQLSNVFSNDYLTQRAGIGYSYNKGRDLNFTARVNYQWAKLANEQTYPDELNGEQKWKSVLPFAMLRYNIRQGTNLRVFYRTNTNEPSVKQLQNVIDNSNPLFLSTGNPQLAQSYSHSLFVRYQSTNVEKSTVFFAMVGGTLTNDYIGNATYYADSDNPIFEQLEIPRNGQLSLPVNLDGHRNMRTFITYGLPLRLIRSNLNLNFSFNYARTPGLLNDELNFANSYSATLGASITSNISDKVDFTLSSRSNLNRVENTLQQQSNSDYLIQTSSLRLNWIIAKGFVLRSDLNHQLYEGLGANFDQNYWIWNFGIGKKLFKNERGELTLSINDLLNQNRNISRNITESYIEDQRTNNLQQYFMLTFTYQIRNFIAGSGDVIPMPPSRPDFGERPWH